MMQQFKFYTMKKILFLAMLFIANLAIGQQQDLNFGTGADSDGETVKSAMTKIQANFDDLYGGSIDQTLSLDGTNLTISGTGGNTVDLSGIGGSVTTDASDLTSGVLADARVQESNVTQHKAKVLAPIVGTGSVINLGSYYIYNDTATDTATFTLSNITAGMRATVLINEATEPSITGATKLPNTQNFVANKKMKIELQVEADSTVYYYFVQLEA